MNSWKTTFRIIWAGQFFSLLTSSIVNFAIILWLSIETGSAEMLAWAAVASLLPQALIGPFTGVLIDRWHRKRIMMYSDAFIAICTLMLAILFWFDIAKMWHIFILLGLRSVGSAFHNPAMQASVPLLAPADQLTRIAGINQMISSVSYIAGPALGALCITIWEIESVLMLDVAGAILAVSSLLFVHIPNPDRTGQKAKNILHEMKDGVLAIMEKPGLIWIFLFSILVMLFLMPVSVLFPLMTLHYFGGTQFQAGLIEALWGLGTLAGGTIMGVRIYKINKVGLVNGMYLLIGATFLLSGLLSSNGFIGFAILSTIAGISGAIYQSTFTGLIQTHINPGVLGRVFSMFYTFSLIPSMLGLIGIGFFADVLGLSTTFILCGGIIVLIGIIAYTVPSAMSLSQESMK
jgi:DHA3 family macrolide efflux protein-like MFS transporter